MTGPRRGEGTPYTMRTSFRVECAGPGDRPCPVHAWWYHHGRGRPLKRCDKCRPAFLAFSRRCPRCGYARADIPGAHDCERRIEKAMRIVAAARATQGEERGG